MLDYVASETLDDDPPADVERDGLNCAETPRRKRSYDRVRFLALKLVAPTGVERLQVGPGRSRWVLENLAT